ncbi:MAG: hypothetical protein ACRBCL_11365 [Maritimibacter sp.]
MNPNQIFRLLRMLLGPLLQRGMNAGIDRAVGRGKAPQDMTEQEKLQARKAKKTANNARKMAKLMRRMR